MNYSEPSCLKAQGQTKSHEHDHEHHHGHDHENGHHHGHSHSHAHSAPNSFTLAFALAISLNLLFVIVEASYALMAHSMGLLADAGHNFGDVMGLTLAWGANLLLTRGATQRFSYGFKRTTIIAAIINALILVAASSIIAYEAISKLLDPVFVNEHIIIIVASIGILINGGTALLFMRGRKEDLNIKGAFLHLAYDALIAFGVVVSGVIILYTHAVWLDPLVALFIVIAILAGTWGLLLDSVNLILDAVPRGIDQVGVKNYLAKIEGVTAVHDLHIWGLSTNENALTAHLVMPVRQLKDTDFFVINEDLKHLYKISHITIQVEKGTAADPCGQVSRC